MMTSKLRFSGTMGNGQDHDVHAYIFSETISNIYMKSCINDTMRGDCSLCCYGSNRWPLLSKLYFHGIVFYLFWALVLIKKNPRWLWLQNLIYNHIENDTCSIFRVTVLNTKSFTNSNLDGPLMALLLTHYRIYIV